MENKKPEVWEKKEDIVKEHITGIGIFCMGLIVLLPAVLNCN
tara:strand:+ start:2752 stop:2877 length:126 start_codon:yes stop_codon:yes gene_type:complete